MATQASKFTFSGPPPKLLVWFGAVVFKPDSACVDPASTNLFPNQLISFSKRVVVSSVNSCNTVASLVKSAVVADFGVNFGFCCPFLVLSLASCSTCNLSHSYVLESSFSIRSSNVFCISLFWSLISFQLSSILSASPPRTTHVSSQLIVLTLHQCLLLPDLILLLLHLTMT